MPTGAVSGTSGSQHPNPIRRAATTHLGDTNQHREGSKMEQLESIQAVAALDEAISEMKVGFNFERYGATPPAAVAERTKP